MAGPGTGRYTVYVPVASNRNTRLRELFNSRASNSAGAFYGAVDETDNIKAAEAAVARATANVNAQGVGGLLPSDGQQAGDSGMFPTGVKQGYGGAPDITEVGWANAGDPANPYTPDLSSPGPGKTSPLDKNTDPGLTVADIKGESYVPGAPNTGTASPSSTSPTLANLGLKPLVKGKSSV